MSTAIKLKRPAVKYYGGKFRMASWITRFFPSHTCYVEPFGGAASVLLQKKPAEFTVYNDLDGEMANFFRVLRDQPMEFMRALELTPYSRAEYEKAYEPTEGLSTVERARRIYIREIQGYAGPRTQSGAGWKYQKRHFKSHRYSLIQEWRDIAHLEVVIERLRNVQFDCLDALKVIERYDSPETLFYVDPPYPAATRCQQWNNRAYQHELLIGDHLNLLNLLRRVKGMVVISTYENGLYSDVLQDWAVETKTICNMEKKSVTEYLYLNAQVRAALDLSRNSEANMLVSAGNEPARVVSTAG